MTFDKKAYANPATVQKAIIMQQIIENLEQDYLEIKAH